MGQLLYLANITRPDITNAARGIREGQHRSRHATLEIGPPRVKIHIRNYQIRFAVPQMKPELTGYSDSDFAGDIVSRKSCTGYVIKLGEAVIEWTSRTQRTVATSTMEAEWIALCAGTRHAEHIRGLLNELGSQQKCVKWWCDNAATVITATTPGHNGRPCHLDVKLKKTREMVTDGLIKVSYIPSNRQEADGLTKRLDKASHKRFRDYLISQ